jgi:hypothetical protein
VTRGPRGSWQADVLAISSALQSAWIVVWSELNSPLARQMHLMSVMAQPELPRFAIAGPAAQDGRPDRSGICALTKVAAAARRNDFENCMLNE